MVSIEAQAETPTVRLRPFWGRIMVIPSDHDEEQTRSGLILPFVFADSPVRRGVVAHVDRAHVENAASMDEIEPGTVVYFVGGLKVLDSIMLMRQEVVAYEVSE